MSTTTNYPLVSVIEALQFKLNQSDKFRHFGKEKKIKKQKKIRKKTTKARLLGKKVTSFKFCLKIFILRCVLGKFFPILKFKLPLECICSQYN